MDIKPLKNSPTPKVVSCTATIEPARPKIGGLWDIIRREFELNQQATKPQQTIVSNPESLLNFVKVPVTLERFMSFGLLYCFVALLKWLVVIPSRFMVHAYLYIRGKESRQFKNDAVTVGLALATLTMLSDVDASKIYHTIKSGTAVKLYFMVGLLEISDKLLSAIGQDVLGVLYGMRLCRKNNLKIVLATILAVTYLSVHSFVLIYQVLAFTVAVNSYSNALLTLILSSQFSEIKSSVFKKLEREGLFQLTCADLNERFLLIITLCIISWRNFVQIYFNGSGYKGILKPNSWYSDMTFSQTINNLLGTFIGPSYVVIGSEFLVDWLKHSYITKFNRIRPSVYNRYTAILARDFLADFDHQMGKSSPRYKGGEVLLRRIGVPIFTLSIVFFKMAVLPTWQYLLDPSKPLVTLLVLPFIPLTIITLVVVRSRLAFYLEDWAQRILKESQPPAASDYANGNPNVHLADASDVRNEFYDQNEPVPTSLEEKRKAKVGDLDSVVRFEMADKRIW